MPTADTLLATYRDECWGDDPEQGALAAAEHQRDTWAKTVNEIRARITNRQADRDTALLLALHVKLDPDGCPVPRQGAPRGPRQRPADPPPAMQAGEEVGARTSAVEDFYAAVQDRAPAAELEALGWTDETAASLSDVSTRILVKHRITWSDLDTWEDEQPFAFGRAWSMADAARVVA